MNHEKRLTSVSRFFVFPERAVSQAMSERPSRRPCIRSDESDACPPSTLRLGCCAPLLMWATESTAIAGITIPQSHSGEERSTIKVEIPRDLILVIKPLAGFATWQDALDAMQDVTVDIEVVDDAGKTKQFRIGREFSGGAGLMSFQRPNGTFDFAGRLVTDGPAKQGTIHLRISDPKKMLGFPVCVELRRQT
jgi:hypothetical protein